VAANFVGLYAASASTAFRDGDIPALELRSGGTYVRMRCYRANCTLRVPETDHYDTYTSSSGLTYVRFYSFKTVTNANTGDRDQVSTVADVYEIKATSTTIRLRKAYTSRWVTLRQTTEKTRCTATAGTWSGTCTCSGNTPGEWAKYVFVAG